VFFFYRKDIYLFLAQFKQLQLQRFR